ncbi:polyprenyl synthetase family protein [Streptomyces racemochromogenes]|uniref:Polyprenyl synthetase family protein n=1 Tax=Streptomyces racemochromogenes TaxID=67353 RepID=A0ABW7PCQ1_9ACTN
MPIPLSSLPATAGPAGGLDLDRIRDRTADIVTEFFATRTGPLARPLREATEGGKMFRPVLCTVGWHAAGGPPADDPALHLGASLELFHASLLIHDDICDQADTRRGRPTLHRALEAEYPGAGTGLALVAGDLLAFWHQEVVDRAPLNSGQLRRARTVFARMREEVFEGQYRELALSRQGPVEDLDEILAVARAKSGNYSVTWPLVLGSTLATADPAVPAALHRYAVPLGEAFQLRDDLLGVFSDPGVSGKPVGDDLREGKPTALLALAWRTADPDQRRVLRAHVGRRDATEAEIAECRAVLVALGVPGRVETMIDERYGQAVEALGRAAVTGPARTTLRHLAHRLAYRDS